MQNLVDGNHTGAVRGINTRTDYVMGENAMAIGLDTEASGVASFASGIRPRATGGASHAEGYDTVSSALASHAEGNASVASGEASHAEGGSTASGLYAHAEGLATQAQGEGSHSEGNRTAASADFAHAEGDQTIASGLHAHSEGSGSRASANDAHAEGYSSTAYGLAAHTEGFETSANIYSHAEGFRTTVNGWVSHAQGFNTQVNGFFSHAEGSNTTDNGFDGVHIMGRYGAADTPYSWFLANGLDEQSTGLAAKILRDGNAYIDVAWNGGGADYAELYETESGQPIEPGCFVTFAGASEKIRLAQSYDEYILGVVSKTPGFVAGTGELRWKNKYKTDEWGGIVYEDVTVPEVMDKEGKVMIPARVESRPVTDPSYDPNRAYVPRMNRPEWVKVGLLGAIRVRDDGTLTPGGYCRPGMNGIATAAHAGYRVLKRTGANQALILLK